MRLSESGVWRDSIGEEESVGGENGEVGREDGGVGGGEDQLGVGGVCEEAKRIEKDIRRCVESGVGGRQGGASTWIYDL